MTRCETDFLKKIDLYGSNIQLNYKQKTSLNTQFGGVMTILLAFFSIGLFYLFGIEIILRSKPFQRFSKVYRNSSEVLVKDFPLAIHVTDLSGMDLLSNYNVSKLMTFSIGSFVVPPLNNSGTSSVFNFDSSMYENVSIVPCDFNKHFGDYKDLFDAAYLPEKNIFCLQTDNKAFYFNDLYTTNSSALSIQVEKCNPKVTDCIEKDPIVTSLLSLISFRIYHIDVDIDLNNFEEPVRKKVNSIFTFAQPNSLKINTLDIKNTQFDRDDGLVFDATEKLYYTQIDKISTQTFTTLTGSNLFAIFYLDSPRIGDYFARSYVKITEVLGYLGGSVNILYIIGNVICKYISETSFYLQQAKDMVDYQDINKEDLEEIVFQEANSEDNRKEAEFVHPTRKDYSNELYISRKISMDKKDVQRLNINNLKAEEEKNRPPNGPQSQQLETEHKSTTSNIITLYTRNESKRNINPENKYELSESNKRHYSSGGSNADLDLKIQTLVGVEENLKVQVNKQDMGLLDYFRVMLSCRKSSQDKISSFIYEASMKFFKTQLDIRNVIKTRQNLDLVKFILFSETKDIIDSFSNFKIPLKRIVIEEEKKLNETLVIKTNSNPGEENQEKTSQSGIKKLLLNMRESFSKKKLFEG